MGYLGKMYTLKDNNIWRNIIYANDHISEVFIHVVDPIT